MVNFTPYQNVLRYEQMSFLQIWRFKKDTTRVFDSFKANGDPSVLLEWEKVALRINDSLNPAGGRFQFFFDIVTLRFIKRKLISSIVTQKLDQICLLTQRKISTEECSLKILQFIEAEFIKQQPLWRQKFSQDVIDEIAEYLKEKKNLIEQGRDVALPHWYHATKPEFLFPIMNGGNIVQSTNGFQGPGVYFSTEDEHIGYGKYTFALDHRYVANFNASYHEGTVSTKGKNCVWLCVQKNITIEWKSVAHLVVDTKQDKEQLGLDMQQNLQDDVLPLASCPVLTRKASDLIRELVQQVCIYSPPFQWSPTKAFLAIHRPVSYVFKPGMYA